MTKCYPLNFIILILFYFSISSCSAWQSPGRKFLEEQGLEFSGAQVAAFLSYQNLKCVRSEYPYETDQVITNQKLIRQLEATLIENNFINELNLQIIQNEDQQSFLTIQNITKKDFYSCQPESLSQWPVSKIDWIDFFNSRTTE